MKWTREDLQKLDNHVSVDTDIEVDPAVFAGSSLINGTKDVHVWADGFLAEDDDRFYVDIRITGTMLVPDAVTSKEITYPFQTSSREIYSFAPVEAGTEEADEIRLAENQVIDLLPAVIDDILLEVPLQVTNASREDYPHGDGWRVMTEEDYQNSRQEELDPRLAKLREFKIDK